MKNFRFSAIKIPPLTWLIGVALLLGPMTSSAKDKPSDAAKKAAERLKGDFDSLQQFEAAAKEATKVGLPVQAVAEAELVFCCTSDVVSPLPALTKQLQAMLPDWKADDSLFFEKREELEGLLSFAQALLAEDANDETNFEKSIKDAFWTSPDLAILCRKAVESHRAKLRDAKLTLPMDLAIPLSNGGQTTLGQLVKDHKAVLLDFWASWCGPCMALMGELRDRAHKLADAKIVVAGVNTEAFDQDGSLEKAKTKAESVRKSKKMDFPWLIEPAEAPFSRLMGISSIPRAVLISPEGKILYNGHPEDAGLAAALAKLDARLANL